MNITKRGITGLIAGAAIGLATIGGAAANSYMVQAQSAERTVVSGAVIRFLPADNGRPSIHANGSHLAAGINGVSINQHGEVVLHQSITDPAKNPILFVQAQADEQLVTRGVTAGVSGGTNTSRIRLYDSKLGRQLDMTKASDRSRIACDTCNLWVGMIHVGGAR